MLTLCRLGGYTVSVVKDRNKITAWRGRDSTTDWSIPKTYVERKKVLFLEFEEDPLEAFWNRVLYFPGHIRFTMI